MILISGAETDVVYKLSNLAPLSLPFSGLADGWLEMSLYMHRIIRHSDYYGPLLYHY